MLEGAQLARANSTMSAQPIYFFYDDFSGEKRQYRYEPTKKHATWINKQSSSTKTHVQEKEHQSNYHDLAQQFLARMRKPSRPTSRRTSHLRSLRSKGPLKEQCAGKEMSNLLRACKTPLDYEQSLTQDIHAMLYSCDDMSSPPSEDLFSSHQIGEWHKLAFELFGRVVAKLTESSNNGIPILALIVSLSVPCLVPFDLKERMAVKWSGAEVEL